MAAFSIVLHLQVFYSLGKQAYSIFLFFGSLGIAKTEGDFSQTVLIDSKRSLPKFIRSIILKTIIRVYFSDLRQLFLCRLLLNGIEKFPFFKPHVQFQFFFNEAE